MKFNGKFKYLIVLGFCFLSANFIFSGNAGNKEKLKIPGSAEAVDAADPFILLYKGTYYAYGTSSPNGFAVFVSKDLKVWHRSPNLCLDKKDSYGKSMFWAPEVYYIKKYSKFYMFYCAEGHICVATSDSPLGPFVQDKKQAIISQSWIDPDVFFDTDGTPYLYFSRFNASGDNIWVVRLGEDLKSVKLNTLTFCLEANLPWEVSGNKTAEGPSVIKKGKLYYLFYSSNPYWDKNYGVGYAVASSPLGPWKKYDGNPILQRPSEGIVGTGHGGIFRDKKGKYRYVFHAHCSESSVEPRQLYIGDLVFAKGGSAGIPSRSIFKLREKPWDRKPKS